MRLILFKIPKRIIYAIEAVLDIALNSGLEPIRNESIAKRQGIPKRYLEQTLQTLVKNRILVASRGPKGGYRLAKERRKIKISDIILSIAKTHDKELSFKSKLSNNVIKPLLNELRDQGVDLPYGCQYGGCITCAAKLINGEVDQRSQVALNNRQINDGYVVLCVARPKTDCEIEIGVESHDKLYRNPFLDPLAPHELKADIATRKDLKKK